MVDTHELYVDLETAKILKEVGFDWDDRGYWAEFEPGTDDYGLPFGEPLMYAHPSKDYSDDAVRKIYPCPTYAVVHKWLLDVKGWRVSVSFHQDTEWWSVGVYDETALCYVPEYEYREFEDAYIYGIKAALKFLIENKKEDSVEGD